MAYHNLSLGLIAQVAAWKHEDMTKGSRKPYRDTENQVLYPLCLKKEIIFPSTPLSERFGGCGVSRGKLSQDVSELILCHWKVWKGRPSWMEGRDSPSHKNKHPYTKEQYFAIFSAPAYGPTHGSEHIGIDME